MKPLYSHKRAKKIVEMGRLGFSPAISNGGQSHSVRLNRPIGSVVNTNGWAAGCSVTFLFP